MKKILLAIDGKHFPPGAFEFIRKLNEQQPVELTGVFLPSIEYTELLYSIGGLSGPIYLPEMRPDDDAVIQKNIDLLWALCKENNIACRIHNNVLADVIDYLKKESRYADILVVSSQLFYENMGEERQQDYLKDVLHKLDCPVVLIPEHYGFPEQIIIAFDGSASSAFALKQFAYLFPEFKSLKTVLVYASQDSDFPDLDMVKEYTKNHFTNISFVKLDIDPKKYFETWLLENKNAMLVAGAYSRSLLSEALKKSFINDIIEDHKIPIFSTHK